MLSTFSDTIAKYDNIFGNITQQKQVISIFIQIENTRKDMKEKLLPGGGEAADRT